VPEAVGPPLSPDCGVGVGCGLGLGVALLGLGLGLVVGLGLGLVVGVEVAWCTVTDPDCRTTRLPTAGVAMKLMACRPTETSTDALKRTP
jgi:hypothetical protein